MANVEIDLDYARQLMDMCEGKTEDELFDMLGENIIKGTMEKEGLTREEAVKTLLGRLGDA